MYFCSKKKLQHDFWAMIYMQLLLGVIFKHLFTMETLDIAIFNFVKLFVMTCRVDLCKKVKLANKKYFGQKKTVARLWSPPETQQEKS